MSRHPSPSKTRFSLRRLFDVEAARPRRKHRSQSRFAPRPEMLEGRALLATLMVCHTVPSDYQSIQAAVDAASPNDTIKVCPGVYNEKVTVNKTLTILGAEAGVDAQTRATTPVANESIVQGPAGATAFYVTANDVTIDGFTVQGATSPNTFGYGILLGAGTHGSKVLDDVVQNNIIGLGLANNSSTDPTIVQHDLFRNNNQPGPSGGTAIYSDQFVSGGNLTNVLIDANNFSNNQNAGINLAASVQGAQSNITISNNSSANDGNFVDLFDTQSTRVSSNTITGSVGSSIFVVGGNSGLTISSNTLSGGQRNGISIDADPAIYGATTRTPNTGLTINDNTIRNFTLSGISVAKDSLVNSTIRSNTSRHNGVDGIFIDTGNSGNLITKNVLLDNARFDAEDLSHGSGTAGTANSWVDNICKTSNPMGLCQDGHHGGGDGDHGDHGDEGGDHGDHGGDHGGHRRNHGDHGNGGDVND